MKKILLIIFLSMSLVTYAQDKNKQTDNSWKVDSVLEQEIHNFILKYGKTLKREPNKPTILTCPKCFKQNMRNQRRLLRKHLLHQKTYLTK